MPVFAAFSHYTKCGTQSEVNQDSAASGTNGTISYAAVFDGHGAFGEVAAVTARDALTSLMSIEMDWDAQPESSMRTLMKSLNQAVLAAHSPEKLPAKHKHRGETYTYTVRGDESTFLVSSSKSEARIVPVDFGCTAAVAVLTQSRRLVVGNLGDAVALVCFAGSDDHTSIKKFSVRHSAQSPEEISRIEAECGFQVRVADGYLQGAHGAVKGLALQPTRGLGHRVWSKFGVSSEPHIVSTAARIDRRAESPEDRKALGEVDREAFAVIVLSDGVSDLLSEERILKIVSNSETPQDAARDLVEEAAVHADTNSDDATAAVIIW